MSNTTEFQEVCQEIGQGLAKGLKKLHQVDGCEDHAILVNIVSTRPFVPIKGGDGAYFILSPSALLSKVGKHISENTALNASLVQLIKRKEVLLNSGSGKPPVDYAISQTTLSELIEYIKILLSAAANSLSHSETKLMMEGDKGEKRMKLTPDDYIQSQKVQEWISEVVEILDAFGESPYKTENN